MIGTFWKDNLGTKDLPRWRYYRVSTLADGIAEGTEVITNTAGKAVSVYMVRQLAVVLKESPMIEQITIEEILKAGIFGLLTPVEIVKHRV